MSYPIQNVNLIVNQRLELAWGIDLRDADTPDAIRMYTFISTTGLAATKFFTYSLINSLTFAFELK